MRLFPTRRPDRTDELLDQAAERFERAAGRPPKQANGKSVLDLLREGGERFDGAVKGAAKGEA